LKGVTWFLMIECPMRFVELVIFVIVLKVFLISLIPYLLTFIILLPVAEIVEMIVIKL
jgi:hypothetical protein